MALQRVDAFRVAFDMEYASSLSDADWAAVIASPEWHILNAENSELLSPVMARFSDKLAVSTQTQRLPVSPIPYRPFAEISQPSPRLPALRPLTGFPHSS